MSLKIRGIFSFLQSDNNGLQDVLEAGSTLTDEQLRDMPVAMRMASLRAVINHVLEDAEQHQHYKTTDQGHHYINESLYEDETAFIARFLKSGQFSPHLKALTHMCALETALWVKNNKPDAFTSPQDKQQFLEQMAAAQTGFFMLGSEQFIAPAVTVKEPPVPYWNGWVDSAPDNEDTALPVPDVNISNTYFHDSETSEHDLLATCFHETMHVLLRQLAHLAHWNQIDENHPVHEDANLLRAYHEYGVAGTPRYRTEYDLNPEENMIRDSQIVFHLQLQMDQTIEHVGPATLIH